MYRRILSFLLVIALLFSFIGCSQQQTPAQSLPSSSVSRAESVSPAESAPAEQPDTTESEAADRYSEVIKIPENKFNIYFFKLDYVEGDTDKSGDCQLLISPEGKTMLIDAGNVSCYNQVLGYLNDLGITKLDYMVVSHPHVDHIGGLVNVIKDLEVDKHYRSELIYTTNTYQKYDEYMKNSGIPTEFLHEGDEFDFGSVHVTLLNPTPNIEYPEQYPESSTQFVNDTSLTMRFDYGDSSYLTCGDLYLSQERTIAEKYPELVDVDVAKANHHGKDTSNSLKWVKAVSAEYVIAMSDDVSSVEVAERYKKKGAEFYNTFLDGVVRVSMDDKAGYEVLSQYDSWLRD